MPLLTMVIQVSEVVKSARAKRPNPHFQNRINVLLEKRKCVAPPNFTMAHESGTQEKPSVHTAKLTLGLTSHPGKGQNLKA